MSNFAKEITRINIEEELKNSYLDYAMSVIIGRALPDIRDGLKPVHRRILFAMHILHNDWNKPYKKSARVVGDVIGKYHPHGDNAVYESIVRMAQSFSLRYTLIDGQGNFGSIDGDCAAAMRYTEIRMTKIAHELLTDIDKETVNYVLNYDNTENIPEVMPTRIPNLLINGSSGIAVGMATNIPPHNISEVINGCLAYIKNNNISVKDLMKYIPGPDFPTAAIINGTKGIEEAYSTGKGKIYIKARSKIENNNKTGKISIIIYEIPYQVNKSRLIEKIAKLVKEKRIEGINNLRDESDKDGMRIVIEIKRDVSWKVILNQLYTLTQLQISFGINMVALYKGKPKLCSLKEILNTFIDHRKEIVIKRTIFELKKARRRAHIIEALIVALSNINIIINLIQKITNINEIKTLLVNRPWTINNDIREKINVIMKPENLESKFGINGEYYFLTENQSQAILDLRLYNLTKLEYKNLELEYAELLNYVHNLISILENNDQLMKVICEELSLIKSKYNDLRITEINNHISYVNTEDLVDQKDVVVTLSHYGYVKHQPISDYEAQKRGGKGKSITNIRNKDFISYLLVANTHDTILLFSSYGKVYWMKVHQLPEIQNNNRGKPIVNLLPLELNERITAILPISQYSLHQYIFMATAHGIVKKTSLCEFNKPRNSGIIAINLNNGDELIGVNLTNGNNEVMLFSSYGKVVRFSENQVRVTKRNAIGVKGIDLINHDKVVSLIIPKNEGMILTVTQNGYGKCTLQKEYPTKSRATKGVISIKVDKRNGKVIGAIQVNNNDQIFIITNTGTLVRTWVSEISVISRNTKGVIIIKTEKEKYVVGLQKVIESINNQNLNQLDY